MIYKFRVFSDINEKFLRCIEIDENDTFLNFHTAIQQSVNFTKKEMASFYLSNDLWERFTQITLMDVRNGEAEDIFSMEQTLLSEFLTEEGENLVYVYDFISDRVFYIVLSEIKNRNMSLTYPICSQTIGEPPVQTLSEKRILKSVIVGKVITNIKKPSTVPVSKPLDKGIKDPKKVDMTKDKKAKPVKVLDKPSSLKAKPVGKADSKSKVVDDKKSTKNIISSKTIVKTKKSILLDDDDDFDIDDDDLDLLDETPAKGLSKSIKKSPKSRSIDDDDDDDDDDEILVDDSIDEVDEDDFNFDESEIETKFKTESSLFNDFDEDEPEDFFDDEMFDNIDDYADRI